ncbi:MAG: Vi polysaccharide biosynthesis protein VipA/TviB [Candidatus Sedimenticola endophacoides]|uniref:Vi polysaccharide biosynthesis UDP-N-acetylglucosamine C-6 dehydrogenase TviB n=1 Tax=Candidatus Sedimenticola endophacoides TaxID=2548426 RepID=A0A657PK01_9GAMM|nr:MAG: Vi polysaccharide biosynthesis protein VipA/TviB [Candidatus Sedimenticola endophacoides]OQX33414.1 MAG: Vi polysaccharide biosynthesis protein VipA/TviB [Candidatus Sedimenticola endophacoides]OQX34084.1 MAG: Vi polysaccharide biosynthesis protein VipA/TviB [Candidatus Sedimenticola endophacoides]OQX42211.1 MAG: Vi polysaccharide biosynthesis protein VipA/TviB [Candidatus Sedimenticola endophacoides]PUE00303.1 MAG: Vi polysaccharide biosynthesis UDP-N-acetylglucosamine C-6 dehydrogenas
MKRLDEIRIGVVGLGYVGLPLAVAFGRDVPTVGMDVNAGRVAELRSGRDSSLEVSPEELGQARRLSFADSVEGLRDCDVYIVTVPTPVDQYKQPDLTPLVGASRMLGEVLKPDDVVIYESTVYPGATEEVCVPELERVSGLRFNRDFYVGYSPERVNPGDKKNRLATIVKVTSGSTPECADFVDALYRTIISAGTHRASSIKVAEAAKVIENTQRDVNIALINELALIFNRLGIDTLEVLEAAGTKWNFLPFRPGLVGGHCIGVDPYYLTYKAQAIGYHPEMILAGRRLNDGMGAYVASRVVKLMIRHQIAVGGSRVLVLGLTFKENCPDLRNTRVVDMIGELASYDIEVDVHDPWAADAEAQAEYGVGLIPEPVEGSYDAVIVAVAHRQFVALGAEGVRRLCKPGGVVYDVKQILPKAEVDGRL